ncbi:MAG: alpha/beta fold hydrolase [Vicinamibacteria bacterium]|nr:alpha/beta fold hydrolase [Vicinamibacteria bacterium]
MADRGQGHTLRHFAGGVLAGLAGAFLYEALKPERRFSPRLLRESREHPDLPATVILPGILGSRLERPDGSEAWLNVGNVFGHHDLRLPPTLPLKASRDALRPFGLIGVDAVIPRLFGFTEYADLLGLLRNAGFHRNVRANGGRGAVFHVFTYDWRRDLVESARRLGDYLDALAAARGETDARFNIVGHSMGGLVARYYLRYGDAEPGGPVTWAGSRRISQLIVVATPNSGSIFSLNAVLNGNPVGMSNTTLAARVIAHMPAIYQLMPPKGTRPLINGKGDPLDIDLHDPLVWQQYGWGPWAPRSEDNTDEGRAFVSALLERAVAFHQALSQTPETRCPIPVTVLGGDCLQTLTRAMAPERLGERPRFGARSAKDAETMFEAGDGRVPRSSVLGSHLDADGALEWGLPEISHTFFGDADHHGIYGEPTFQSVLLRRLLRPARKQTPQDAS